MTALSATVAGVDARVSDHVVVDIVTEWSAARDRWRHLAQRGVAGMFQQTAWLDAWFATLGREPGIDPLIVFLRTRERGDVAALPLVRRQAGAVSFIEFADGGVTDYGAPIFARSADESMFGSGETWRKIRAALPRADILSLQKMPAQIGNRRNALAYSSGSYPSSCAGHVLAIPDEWEDWRKSLNRAYRKEMDRFWRVFTRHEDARFERIMDLDRARAAYDALRVIQRERMAGKVEYTLDEPAKVDFYWSLIRDNLASGYIVLTALSAGDDFAGLLLGVAHDDTYAMLRLAPATGKWSSCSPGRLLIERTMHAMHGEGYRAFDFTIGSYDYKRRFGAVPTQLRDMAQANSLRGAPFVVEERLRGFVRAHPGLRNVIDKARGKAPKATPEDKD